MVKAIGNGVVDIRKKFVKDFKKNKVAYFFLAILLGVATFFRTFRTHEVLGFYFDQGRDALVIYDLINGGKFFLIGPTTGIAGIFRGPAYYYLITPLYWIGNGNPVYPAVFLALLCVLALVVIFYVSRKAGGTFSGILAVAIASSSFYLVYASRWLSNPTPMLLLSSLLVLSMGLVRKKQYLWIIISGLFGISLFHFGSSGEFFYLFGLILFAIWQTKLLSKERKLPSVWVVLGSLLAFTLTALPLILFDMRHEGILFKNIKEFFIQDQSFKADFWKVAGERIPFLFDVFYSKVFHSKDILRRVLFVLPLLFSIRHVFVNRKNDFVVATTILLSMPFIGFLLFQGNEGNVYDYYLTGYYLIFVLFLSFGLSAMAKNIAGRAILIIFLALFVKDNVPPTLSWIRDGGDGPTTISFGNQKRALDWIYEDARGEEFNVDVYVPPVIPYSYSYLLKWYSDSRGGLTEKRIPLLYTIYEVDPPHPERLDAWMKRQEGIGEVLYEEKFGGITVQKRSRIKYED